MGVGAWTTVTVVITVGHRFTFRIWGSLQEKDLSRGMSSSEFHFM